MLGTYFLYFGLLLCWTVAFPHCLVAFDSNKGEKRLKLGLVCFVILVCVYDVGYLRTIMLVIKFFAFDMFLIWTLILLFLCLPRYD